MASIIELKNVSFSYSEEDKDQDILKNINLMVEEGEWLAILGPNGSGKSTLVKTLNGILPIQSGEIWVDGQKLSQDTVWTIREKIGMVFQNPDNQFVGATVGDDVAFGLENQAVPHEEMTGRVMEALEQVDMVSFIDREPSSLSGGQKQRVAIAGILALNPNIIVLDEATSMLDPHARKDILATVRKLRQETGMTVLSITHDIEEATEADRVLVMKDGEIFKEGQARDIFSQRDMLIELGLDLPFSEKVKMALQQRGLDLPDDYRNEEELRDDLWTLKSKI